MPPTSLPILNCDGCGACCLHQAAPPFMPTELDVLPTDLRREVEHLSNEWQDDATTPCVWLGPNKKCLHYEHRPEACRQFECAGEDCINVRRRHNIG